jgi:5'-deoxynucleotidase YfbR-like HD superfamily hydrolase
MRWSIVRTHRQQNLSEHHYLVTMIARDMAAKIGMTDPSHLHVLTEWCLIHDTPEVLTGDLPTRTKGVIKPYINMKVIEDSTSQEYARLRQTVEGTPVETVGKLADMMEGILFLEEEGVRVDVATTHTNQVLRRCVQLYREEVENAVENYTSHGFRWHRLYQYREELAESPIRELHPVVRGA